MQSINENDKLDWIGDVCFLIGIKWIMSQTKKLKNGAKFSFKTKLNRKSEEFEFPDQFLNIWLKEMILEIQNSRRLLNVFQNFLCKSKNESSSFDKNYDLTMKLMKKFQDQIKIAILIDDIETTDRKFNGNNKISKY